MVFRRKPSLLYILLSAADCVPGFWRKFIPEITSIFQVHLSFVYMLRKRSPLIHGNIFVGNNLFCDEVCYRLNTTTGIGHI